MPNRLTTILLAVLLTGTVWAAQPSFHSAFSVAVIEQGSKQLDLGLLNAPVYGIASHIAADRMIGESALDYQLDIAGVRYLIMYVNTPDKDKMTFVVDSFWGLFPDIWDKGLNRMDFHTNKSNQVFPMNRGATEMLEELSVFKYTVKF